MNFFSKRWSVLALALGPLVFTSIACDSMESDAGKADRRVQESVEKSAQVRLSPTTQALNTALTDLNKAASETGASLTSKIQAKSLLAQAELESADRTVRDLDRLDPAISRTMWEIGQIASQIQSVNDDSKAVSAADPQATLKSIADKRAEMVAAGEAAAKKAAELQTEIDKVKAQVQALTQQKDAAIAEADAAADKASKADEKARPALMAAVTESRRKGGNLGHDIDKQSAALLPLERDQAAEQIKKKTADEAVAALDQDKKRTEESWQATQAQVQGQKALASKLGEELAAKAKALDGLVKQASALRVQAVQQYGNAQKHYAAAANDARSLANELGTWGNNEKFSSSPEKKAWDQLRALYHPNLFKQLEAQAQIALGNLYSSEAALQQEKAKLVAAITKPLQDAGLTLPAALATSAEDAKALAAANQAYTEATTNFLDSATGTPKDVQQAAKISAMFAAYSQYLNGDKAKLGEAKKLKADAFGDSKDDPFLRVLPTDLQG